MVSARFHRKCSMRFALALLFLFLLPAALHGDSAETSDAAVDDGSNTAFDDEITVTGQQQERGLQDTPDSVAVTTGKQLENRSIVDLYELVEQTPNVNASFGFKGFSVRGIDQRGFGGGGGQLVAVRVDGATLQNNQTTFFGPYSAWDLEQVEVFRGPQSTQQGRNALAGAIVIRSADPTYETEVKGRLSVGTLGSYQGSAAVNLPLVENKVALRVSVDQREMDGWVDNPTRDEDDYDFRDAFTGRAKLRFDPTDRFSGILTFSYTDSTGGEDVIVTDRFPDRLNFSDLPGEEGSIHEILTLEMGYLLNDRWSVRSTTNVYEHDYIRFEDGDNTPLPGNQLEVDQNDEGFSQQIRFLYAGNGGRQGVLGLYYADLEDNRSSRARLPGEVLGLPPGFVIDGRLDNLVFTENFAVFGEIDLPLGDRFTLTAGARFDDEKKTDASRQVILIDPPLFSIPGEPPQDLDSEYDAFLPKLGLTYEVSENTNASFTVQQGYRAGGRSQSLISLTVSDFEPEETTNYELALRTLLPERGLRFNANLFYIDWEDQQVTVRTALDSEFDTITVNAGTSRLYGLEAQVDYRVRDGLDLFASLGLVETEFTDFVDGNEVFTGNEFPFAPNVSATAGARWRPAERWRLDASVSHTGSLFSDQDNNPQFEVDPRTLVNLRLSRDWDSFTVAAFARNLFDEDYLVQSFPTGSRSGEPQVVGLELSFGL
ncbi:MAG: TonB-dependent receptor [Acidobacteriota bacterium]